MIIKFLLAWLILNALVFCALMLIEPGRHRR
jgi:hypothetical protein